MVTILETVLKKRWQRVMKMIYEEELWPQTFLFYVAMVIIGTYNLLFANTTPDLMKESLDPWQYTTFLYMCIFGPLVSMAGRGLKGDLAYTGRWMQLTGDTAAWGVAAVYTVATIYTQPWGQGNIGGGFVIAFAFGSFLSVIRGVMRVSKGDSWVKVS